MVNPTTASTFILPTHDSRITLQELLGPAVQDLEIAEIQVEILVEYALDQWIRTHIDQELLESRGLSIYRSVASMAVMDFVLQNQKVMQYQLDRHVLEASVNAIVYFVFNELIPQIEAVGLTEDQLSHLHVKRWLGRDLVMHADNIPALPNSVEAEINRRFNQFITTPLY